MSELGRLLAATRACVQEGVRRELGLPADARFDVPVAMLLDLADEMEDYDPHAVDVLVEELHAEIHPKEGSIPADGPGEPPDANRGSGEEGPTDSTDRGGEDEGATASKSSPSGAAA